MGSSVPTGYATQVALVPLDIRFDLGIRRTHNRLDQIHCPIRVRWGGFSPGCLPDRALRHGQATFWNLLPVDLYHPHRNPLMRLLNAIDAAMAHADLVK